MIYLIQRIDFDNLENHDPLITSIEGYFLDEPSAKAYCQQKLEVSKKYRGWDSNDYPYFEIIEVEQLVIK